jgi:hypothetical protein
MDRDAGRPLQSAMGRRNVFLAFDLHQIAALMQMRSSSRQCWKSGPPSCGKEISRSAPTCPNCGHKPSRTSGLTSIITFILGAAVIGGIFSAAMNPPQPAAQQTPEQVAATKREDQAVRRATLGAIMLKKSMRDPDSFKLESALVINGTGAVCYDYRAHNGFGGVNAEQAVLSADGMRFKTSTMDGFAALWNRECANKSGEEMEAGIRWTAL